MPASKKTIVEDDVYEMEDIIGFRVENNQEQWLVKWKGYDDPSDLTWEPRSNFLNPGPNLANKLENYKKMYYKEKSSKSGGGGGSRKRGATTTTTNAATKEAKPERSRKSRKTADDESSHPENETANLSPVSKAAPPPQTTQERDMKPTGPQGDVVVSHIGKGTGNSKEYVVSLRWSNGYEQQAEVSEVRALYSPQLLDYLLSRVRFRDDRHH